MLFLLYSFILSYQLTTSLKIDYNQCSFFFKLINLSCHLRIKSEHLILNFILILFNKVKVTYALSPQAKGKIERPIAGFKIDS